MKFSLKQLKYIYTVLVTENISRAAEKCFVSQPAMSQIINEFEKNYDLLLFERVGRKLKITSQGESLKKELAIFLLAAQDFENKISEIKDITSGKVRIGIPPVILSVYFYDIISNFMSQNPDIELEIVEMGANRLINELMHGDIELAVLIEPFEDEMCKKTVLTESTFSVVINKQNELSKERIEDISDLAGYPLVLLNEEFQLYDVILKSFKKRGVTPDVVFKSKQWDLLINMVKHNPEVVSILPTPIIEEHEYDKIKVYPIDLDVKWKIILVERKTLNKTISNKKFLEFTKNFFN
ncbi:LysR family transcriptional regulator [Vagococcus carniphilus]|uniref:LysR family transcriptional regulator n=1 Tax=Vagococcus carniphilus TaxID=218144 RepID=A0AAW8U5M9_9ENTE|nr:LysR family transcriptional regulator [Vagococcus carniphilus]MDT2829348.1 LysR family transcriptional regulator [Vagococcus carniphilus]MDT2833445.1 LysR family transcriptional regulator [Vagococcus carniphilus]MDT2838807.1 LysR family transcriptional regulator [Vagococcus carniphilus]MDT2852865.1 LysR family transcriptional regulator [Vagococcus carniphilus]